MDAIVQYNDVRDEQTFGYAIEPRLDCVTAAGRLYEQRYGLPAAATTEVDAAAFVNCGRWLWQCGCGSAQLAQAASKGLCAACGQSVRQVFPAEQASIEAELLKLPGYRHLAPVRHWRPGWSMDYLRERTAAAAAAQALAPQEMVRRLSIGATRMWVDGELLTASNMNTHLTEVLNDLAGRNGLVELEDSLQLANGTGGNYLRLPGGTTAQRPASPGAGALRFNTTQSAVDVFGLTTGQWGQLLDSKAVTAANLRASGGVGLTAAQVAPGVHNHTPTPLTNSFSGVPSGTSPATVTYSGSSPGWWILVVATAPGRNNTRRFASGYIAFDDTSLAPASRIKIFDSRVSDPDGATEPVRFYPIAASAGSKSITLRQFSSTAAVTSTTYSNWFYYIAFITLGTTA